MAFKTADMVQETTSTTGTVTVELNGAAANHQSFASAIGSGNTCPYTIFGQGDWETGIGTVTAGAPDTLARTTVLASSNSNAKVAFAAGTKTVLCGIPAELALIKDSTGKLGIGIGSDLADGTIHVHTATAGVVVAHTDYDELVLENNASGGLNILTPNTAIGGIAFGDPEDNNVGNIQYLHSGNQMQFIVNAGTRMTIDSANGIGIGTAAPDGSLHVHAGSAGTVTASGSGNAFVIENGSAGNLGMSLLAPDAVSTNILFGCPSNTAYAQIQGAYGSGSPFLALRVNSAEGMRIDASGHLLVGATAGSYHVIRKSGLTEGDTVLDIDGGSQPFRVRHMGGAGYNAAATGALIGRNSVTLRSINAGGTLNASGADYAEYKHKRPDCGPISKGDICGRDAAGLLTDKWSLAKTFWIKSTDPSYVGGDTWGSEEALGLPEPKKPVSDPPARGADETENTHNARVAAAKAAHLTAETQYATDKPAFDGVLESARQTVDRIAYSGDVPVNIVGAPPEAGDYLLPAEGPGDTIKGVVVLRTARTADIVMDAIGVFTGAIEGGKPVVSVKIG